MATIDEVAKLAGVSKATVSRVINNSANVNEETRAKVLSAIEKLKFKPKFSAKALAKSKKQFNIAICLGKRMELIKDSTDEIGQFYGIILKEIKGMATFYGINVKEIILENPEENFDGYILVGGDVTKNILELYKNFKKPLILLDHYIPGEKIDSILPDSFSGAFYAVNYLIKKEMKKIVHIHGPLNSYGFRSRYNGYTEAMMLSKLKPIYYEYDDVRNNMDEVIKLLIKNNDMPQAIFASNDITAIRVIEELKKYNIKIPEDISVVGFDDIPKAKKYKLTTVKVYKQEMGNVAFKRLYELMLGENTHPIRMSLFTEFIKRKSSK
ncbi:LacI family transcriptional regulator [Marinitoga sp. 1197]|uniref:LacI family DNA-binding transcriptional regulator n=1 Tax=Marinitoga sp. 1197 TaxID=1428449 RepID=UPI000640D13F|nr:LacI family DNA-binding transcriptional regulator [Marinitoga sp. 1197]KLO23739.1 LacI family transcriptional regulator [Marinitoga sp. 1197]